ncbi:hypothetical protein [Rhizobium sp.]
MGTWSISAEVFSEAGLEDTIYAPSMASLPAGYPLVMATVPVIDWNAALTTALRQIPAARGHYAAVMMVDPFTLWEDLADLLKEKGITGVVNFPPASLLEGATPPTGGASENTLEMDRLKWFSDAGFKLVYAASDVKEIANTALRLEGLVDAFLHLPPSALDIGLGERIMLGTAHHVSERDHLDRPVLTPVSA